MNDGNIMTM